jgi:hypothetical protein
MGDLYTEITAARTAAGVLWSPALSIDHLGNAWMMVGVFDCGIPGDTIPGVPSPAWTAPRHSFDIYLPPDWALDTEFDPDLEIRLAVDFNISAVTGSGALRIASSTVNGIGANVSGTGWTAHSIISWVAADLQENQITIDVEAFPGTTGNSFTYSRGGRSTCYLEARIP